MYLKQPFSHLMIFEISNLNKCAFRFLQNFFLAFKKTVFVFKKYCHELNSLSLKNTFIILTKGSYFGFFRKRLLGGPWVDFLSGKTKLSSLWERLNVLFYICLLHDKSLISFKIDGQIRWWHFFLFTKDLAEKCTYLRKLLFCSEALYPEFASN